MYERFTDRARKVMHLANEEARRFNHEYIGTEHILLGLIKEGSGVAANVLKNLDIDLRKIRLEVEKIVQPGPDMVSMGKLPQTPRAKKVIEYSIEEARDLNHNYVGTEHLLLGLLREQEAVAAQVLMNLGLELEEVREEVLNLLGHNMQRSGSESAERTAITKPPTLESFGRDLTEEARQGKLNPLIGRKNEMERILLILQCRTHNNPLLIGEMGVGKTAIIHGFAQWNGEPYAAERMRNQRIVAWNLSQMIALLSTYPRPRAGIETIMDHIRQAKNLVLFLADVHTLAGAQAESSYTCTLFKQALAHGEVQCIGTATQEKYISVIATDSILGRHFRPIAVKPASPEETVAILHSQRQLYENHHHVRIADDALEAAMELSDRYLTDRALPGKAILLLDEASALVYLRNAPPLPPQ
jgi:ATP-dependent Clp protease ATP-binding subunit ClpC